LPHSYYNSPLVKGLPEASFPPQATLFTQQDGPAAIPRKGGVTMAEYEMVFIVQPEMEEEPRNALVEKITQTISDLKGTVQKVDPWGKRRLAYPIKTYREGFYVLVQMDMPPSALRPLERAVKLMEDIIRHLIVRRTTAPAAPQK
jgi:small subunit ribosomal protein S6